MKMEVGENVVYARRLSFAVDRYFPPMSVRCRMIGSLTDSGAR